MSATRPRIVDCLFQQKCTQTAALHVRLHNECDFSSLEVRIEDQTHDASMATRRFFGDQHHLAVIVDLAETGGCCLCDLACGSVEPKPQIGCARVLRKSHKGGGVVRSDGPHHQINVANSCLPSQLTRPWPDRQPVRVFWRFPNDYARIECNYAVCVG